ncbi:NifB/NifX family molybdenum-iron cluster-binding protein [Calditrichota bacterium LG25]
MRIAIGTDDLQTIRSGHFGESKYYKIFTVEDGKIVQEEIRENPYVKNEDHEHGQAKNIMQLLKDCDVFLARSMGMHSIPRLVEKGKKPMITRINSIDEAIGRLIGEPYDDFKCFNTQSMKFMPCAGGL